MAKWIKQSPFWGYPHGESNTHHCSDAFRDFAKTSPVDPENISPISTVVSYCTTIMYHFTVVVVVVVVVYEFPSLSIFHASINLFIHHQLRQLPHRHEIPEAGQMSGMILPMDTSSLWFQKKDAVFNTSLPILLVGGLNPSEKYESQLG